MHGGELFMRQGGSKSQQMFKNNGKTFGFYQIIMTGWKIQDFSSTDLDNTMIFRRCIYLPDIVISIYNLYPVHGDKNHHKPDIFIGENIDTLNGF